MSGSEVAGIESRTIADVQASTRFLLDSFKAKMAGLKGCSQEIKSLMRFGVDFPLARTTAKKFFGSEEVNYIAIDGTNSIDQQLDLIVFYVGAFAYSGQLAFRDDSVMVGNPKPGDSSLSVSTAIPLSEEDAAIVFGQKKESGVEVDTERLPASVMHLAEYYLAYNSILESKQTKVLLLDRTLAGDVAHLVWSTRDLIWDKLCVLQGIMTPSGPVTAFDLELARMLLPNLPLSIPASRSQFLKFAAVMKLFDGSEMTAEQLAEAIGANPKRVGRLRDDLAVLDDNFGIFEHSVSGYKLKPGVERFWDRVHSAAMQVAFHVFRPMGGHPLRFTKLDEDAWVTADDLDFIVLVLIQAITRKAWQDNVLAIGLTKDTNAFELVKTVVPLLDQAKIAKSGHSFPNFNSDKMLLQTDSVANSQDIPTPWHTIEIDAAFRTMAPVADESLAQGSARINGAYGNVVYPERIYAKTYIQLWSSKSEPEVRSHVFTFDRPVFAGYDHWDEILLYNRDGGVDETISPVLHYSRGSEMTNLAMAMLVEMGKEVVPEALGHNYPLFLADKKAKAVLSETRQAYLGAVAVELAKSDLNQQVLFSQRFRDYRSQIEGKRKA